MSSLAVERSRSVLQLSDLDVAAVCSLLERFSLQLRLVPDGAAIPGSYWGDREAGLIGSEVYGRADTPLHSIFHEASHAICMDGARRRGLDRDAGGDHAEENAVCYLQILLARQLTAVGDERMCDDMDAWGYTFRLGSARAWFEHDASDARQWLLERGLIDQTLAPTYRCCP